MLPAIFSVDRQLIMNHVMTLVSILPNCADSDSLALLTLFDLVAKVNKTSSHDVKGLSEGGGERGGGKSYWK